VVKLAIGFSLTNVRNRSEGGIALRGGSSGSLADSTRVWSSTINDEIMGKNLVNKDDSCNVEFKLFIS
jgi:hypothetical protein